MFDGNSYPSGGLERRMAAEEGQGERRRRPSIYHRQGQEGDNTILEIESAYHPRATENIKKDLTAIMQRLMNGFTDAAGNSVPGILDKSGKVVDPTRAADLFMQLLAEYHFQDTYDAIKHDTQAVNRELESIYGVNFENKRQQFDNARYVEEEDFYREHREPLIGQVDNYRKDRAGRSLQNIIQDEERSEQLKVHLKARFGKDKLLKQSALDRLHPQTVLGLVQTVASSPGYNEIVRQDPLASVNVPEELIGSQPKVAAAFQQGESYRTAYERVPRDVDDTHRIKSKRQNPVSANDNTAPDYKAA